MSPVYRIESHGEEAVPFPNLPDAMHEAPTHPEAYVATSRDGVILAEACPQSGSRSLKTRYSWELTVAGRDVVAVHGWRCAS